MEAYEQLERLGRGQYGAVHRVRQRATGRVLAMKRVFVGGDEGQVHRPPTPLLGPLQETVLLLLILTTVKQGRLRRSR